MLLVFRHTSNQRSIQKAKAQLIAALYEMLLFPDEPLLVLRAQVRLLGANLRYLGWMLVPAAVMTIPMLALFANFEAIYGLAPLRPGKDALVVMQMRDPIDIAKEPPALKTPPGIAVETPAVRIPSQRQISWRIRAERAVSGSMTVSLPGGAVEKRVDAADSRYISERRVNSIWGLFWHPGESPIRNRTVEWIEIQYPHSGVRWLGLDMPWEAWLLIISILSALAFKRRLRVAF